MKIYKNALKRHYYDLNLFVGILYSCLVFMWAALFTLCFFPRFDRITTFFLTSSCRILRFRVHSKIMFLICVCVVKFGGMKVSLVYHFFFYFILTSNLTPNTQTNRKFDLFMSVTTLSWLCSLNTRKRRDRQTERERCW